MAGIEVALDAGTTVLPLAQASDIRSPGEIFSSVFEVFLVLGTLVGVVVISYTLYNAYKYRDGGGDGVGAKDDRPEMGELPTGGGGGKKLFLSFAISAIIVLSLIVWTYGLLLDVESGTINQEAQTSVLEDPLEVEVIGEQYSWQFVYQNNRSEYGELVVPRGRAVRLSVTSADVFHNFGIRGLGLKADAIPGQHTQTWFVADETGNYAANCYELCGTGHSQMTADVRVLPQDEFQTWYENSSDSA